MNDISLNHEKPKFSVFSSIKFKVWLGILVLTILPLISIGYYSFNVLADISCSLLIESNIQAFQQVKYEVDQYVSTYEDLTRFLASDIRLQQPQTLEAWQALQQLDQSYEYVERIVLCDSEGNLLRHSKPEKDSILELSIPEKMLARSNQNIMFSPEAFLVKAPIGASTQNQLIVTVSFLKLRKSLEGITFGTNFRYFLVTQDGENILDQPDFPQELISDLMQRPCGAYDVLSNKSPKQIQVVTSLPILHYRLRIFVFQNAGEVYAVVNTIKEKAFNFVVVIGIIALLLGTYFSFKLTEPVIEIAKKAYELSEGNLDTRVQTGRNDELGFLAACFNIMARRIRNKVFELSALYRVSQIINTSTTYQQAVDECLSHIVEIFKASRGSIMLLNDDRTKLRVESFKQARQIDQETDSNSHKAKIELDVGEGIAGEVVATSTPILCMDCAADKRFKSYDSNSDFKAPQTLVSVPLIVHNTCVGVLNLSDRISSEPFNQEDMELLQAIASQMAMSIDNAHLHELTITDDLTELYVAKYFHIRLEDEIKRAKRFSFPLTLVMFEADNFNQIIEKHSSRIGDAILYEIGKALKDSVRATDIPCRSGTEEFAVILAHTNAEQATIFAERFRERIANTPVIRGNEEVKITISLGLVEFTPDCSSSEQMIVQAAKALAKSKQNGGNQTTSLNFKNGGVK